MLSGSIFHAARRDSKSQLMATLVLFGLCALVLGYNWVYVYNWIAGPFSFDPMLAKPNGPREFITLPASELQPTTVYEESTVRLFRGALESTSHSADYYFANIENRTLIVKMDPEFSGDVVEGRLFDLPNTLRGKIQEQAPAGVALHPAVLDAKRTAYRWDFNLFVLAAAPLMPIALIGLAYSLWQTLSVENHSEIRQLKKFGNVRSVVARIENELEALGDAALTGGFWLSDDWILTLEPDLKIFAVPDLVAVGLQSSILKGGSIEYTFKFWRKSSLLVTDVKVTGGQASVLLDRLKQQFPWLVVEDIEAFENRWRDDKESCLAESAARRQGS